MGSADSRAEFPAPAAGTFARVRWRGKELFGESLPAEGLFEVGFGEDTNVVWCWPASWFARGMAGAVWLPVDPPARTLYRIALNTRTAATLVFPDAVADCAINPRKNEALVSCWDGSIYLLDPEGTPRPSTTSEDRRGWPGAAMARSLSSGRPTDASCAWNRAARWLGAE